jgi:hypothetical protein
MISKKIHAVFPKEYKDVLLSGFAEKEYEVINYDNTFDTFHNWATSKEETISDVAIIAQSLNDDLPLEVRFQEFLEKLTEIRIQRPTLRLIIFLPKEADYVEKLKERLVQLVIYDFYFNDNFSFDDLVTWIENPRHIGDMKEYILAEKFTANEKSILQNKQKQEEEVSAVEGKSKENEKLIEGDQAKSRIARNQYRTKVKRVIEERIVEVERVVTIKQKKIAVFSLSRGAGATFHTLCLGAYFSNRNISVGIYENPIYQDGKTYQADALSVFEDENENKISVANQIAKKLPVLKEQIPSVNDTKYYSLKPNSPRLSTFQHEDFLRYFNLGDETVKIFDFGYLQEEVMGKDWFVELMEQFDLHVICLDMMPTSLIPNMNRLEFFLNDDLKLPVKFIANKLANSIDIEDLDDLGLEDLAYCKHLNYDLIFDAYYQNIIPYNHGVELREILNPIYNQISELIQLSTTEQPVKTKGKGFSFFNRKKSFSY